MPLALACVQVVWVLEALAERAAVVVVLWPPWPRDDQVEEGLLVSALCCLCVAAFCVAVAPRVVCGLLVAWCALWLHRWRPPLEEVAGGSHFAFPFRASP